MRTIAIALLALGLAHAGARAQTADEQARILRGFEQSVANYTLRPRIFTPPVAVVFRQMIARALAERDGVVAINGAAFPRVLEDALPRLPAPLEYRLIGHDLVVRDKEADIVVGVLRDAVGSRLIVNR